MKFKTFSKVLFTLIVSFGLFESAVLGMEQTPKQSFIQKHSKYIQKILKGNDVILSSLLYMHLPTLAIPCLDKIPYVGNGINGLADILVRANLFRPISDVCNNIVEEKSNKKLSAKLFPLLTLDHLLNNKFDINILSKALEWSVSGQSLVAFFKLALRYAPDKYRLPLLQLAIECKSVESVKLLTNSGIDINGSLDKQRNTPLIIAVLFSNFEVVDLLLQNHADVNRAAKDGYTAIHAAIKAGREGILEKLINLEVDVNAITKRKITPLMIAARNSNPKLFNMLLKAGADVSISSPLVEASRSGNLEIVNKLVALNVDINQVSNIGETPLYTAIMNGHTNIVEFLLKNGAKINKQMKNAACFSDKKIKQLLMRYTGELIGINYNSI